MKILLLLLVLYFSICTNTIFTCPKDCIFKNGCEEQYGGTKYCNPEINYGICPYGCIKGNETLCVPSMVYTDKYLQCPVGCSRWDYSKRKFVDYCAPNPYANATVCEKNGRICPIGCVYSRRLKLCVSSHECTYSNCSVVCEPIINLYAQIQYQTFFQENIPHVSYVLNTSLIFLNNTGVFDIPIKNIEECNKYNMHKICKRIDNINNPPYKYVKVQYPHRLRHIYDNLKFRNPVSEKCKLLTGTVTKCPKGCFRDYVNNKCVDYEGNVCGLVDIICPIDHYITPDGICESSSQTSYDKKCPKNYKLVTVEQWQQSKFLKIFTKVTVTRCAPNWYYD